MALFKWPVNPVRAEYEFRCRRQGATESVNNSLTALHTFYADSHNTATTDPMISNNIEQCDLAMQLVIGCYMRRTQEKLLLQETEVSLDTFVCIMQADKTAALSSTALYNETATATIAATCKRQPPNNKNSNQCSSPLHAKLSQRLENLSRLWKNRSHFQEHGLSSHR